MISYILGWSEVWALLFPIAVLLRNRKQPDYLKPVIIYVFVAFVINLCADIISNFKKEWNFPYHLQTNNYLYNLHSIVRFYLFAWFFIRLDQPFLVQLKKLLLILFLAFIIINFGFFEEFFQFHLKNSRLSSRLLATEAALLLFFCVQYYLYRIKDDTEHENNEPHFWVVTGLSIYVVVCFFIFLFQNSLLIQQLKSHAITIWKVHDVFYIILSLFLAKAFNAAKE